jgi:RNA polymerase sigma-70 factor (ECF subfamily)
VAVRAELVGEATGVDLDRDRALVMRYQEGDEAAFDELYTRYYPRLHLYCRRRVGDIHVAEELAQEAFVRALRAMPRFAGERRFYPWMTVIAQRLCIDHHRSSARVEPAAEIDTGAVEADPGDVFTAVDRGHLVAALDRVAPRHREVLRLREQEGWSYQQIADHFAVPVTTVEALLHRARKSLRREFLAVGGGRLSSIPVFAGIAAWFGRMRARLGATGESSANTGLQAATAGVAAITLAVAPFVVSNHDNPQTLSVPSDAHAAVAAATVSTPDPSAAVVDAVPAAADASGAAPTGAPTAAAGPPAPTTDLGLIQTYTGEEAASYWQEKQKEAPIYLNLVVMAVSLDPAATLQDLLSPLDPKK